MKIRILLTSAAFTLCLLLNTLATASEDGMSFKEYLQQANEYIKAYRHFEASDALKEATKLGGAKHPSLHMRLGILYYGLGLIPEAITEGEKAVTLAPSSKWYKYDLAKFYYVDKQLVKAEQQFIALLRLDPGFTLGYYYLAELYFQKKEYDMAWLSLQRSIQLGHQGKQLTVKLEPLTTKPTELFDLASDNNQLFRFVKLSSAEQAQTVVQEIWDGKLFENLELELKKEKSDNADFGVMMLNELKEEVANSLRDTTPYSSPVVIKTGPDYRIMQRILPFDPDSWKYTSGREATSNEVIAEVKTAPLPVAIVAQETVVKAELQKDQTTEPAVQENNRENPPKLSNKLAAFYALESWKIAWESQDVDEYFLSYSKEFTPADGKSLQQWVKKRTGSITKPKSIQLKIEEPVIETLSEKQLLVTFKQYYESNTYSDIVIKTLTMDKETEGWKITQEREIQKLFQ